MNPLKHIRSALRVLFGLLLVCWPAVDTEPMGAVTVSRIVLGGGMLLLSVATIAIAGFQRQQLGWRLTDWVMLACGAWFIGNVVFVGRGETDPYNLLNGSVVLAAYIFMPEIDSDDPQYFVTFSPEGASILHMQKSSKLMGQVVGAAMKRSTVLSAQKASIPGAFLCCKFLIKTL